MSLHPVAFFALVIILAPVFAITALIRALAARWSHEHRPQASPGRPNPAEGRTAVNDANADEVELGWVKVTRVLADTPSGVDIQVDHSEQMPVHEALGMLATAQHIIWENAEDDE